MLNCKQASTLSSEQLDRKLTLRERLALRMHLVACRLCSRYAKQLDFLRETSRRFDAHDPGIERLSDEARERMRERLKSPGE